MNKLFKILLGVSLLFTCSFAIEQENRDIEALTSFSDGFNMAFKGLSAKEFGIQGLSEAEVDFEEFMIVVDTTGMDDARRFAIQLVGFRYDDSVRVKGGNWIVLSSYSRKPNATSLAMRINNKYFAHQPKNRQAFVYQKPIGKVFYKEKSFFSKIASIIEEDIKKNTKILYVKDTTFVPAPKEESEPKVEVKKNISLVLENRDSKDEEQKHNQSFQKNEKMDKKIEDTEAAARNTIAEMIKKDKKEKEERERIIEEEKRIKLLAEKEAQRLLALELKKQKKETVDERIIENVKFVFMPAKIILYDFPTKLYDKSVSYIDFRVISDISNEGKTYVSIFQKKTKEGQVFFYVDDLKFWVAAVDCAVIK